jgi:hypothetical protein
MFMEALTVVKQTRLHPGRLATRLREGAPQSRKAHF